MRLRKSFRYPFNLWLLEKILNFTSPKDTSPKDIKLVSQIRSEVQMFDLFWKQRVDDVTGENVLRKVSHQMVKQRSLTARVDDIHDEAGP